MIAIVSSAAGERAALAALCEQQAWPHAACDSLRTLEKLLQQTTPQIIVTRNRLVDGYSDDVLKLIETERLAVNRTIVLYAADLPPAHAARQISLGADCVLRDPVRVDVLVAYLARYASAKPRASARRPKRKLLRLAGAVIDPIERIVRHSGRQAALTPREVELARLLCEAKGGLISYQMLYSEILGRPFRGETSNMRVLLSKLDASFRRVGLELRQHVAVIPKAGYRCRLSPRAVLAVAQDPAAPHFTAA